MNVFLSWSGERSKRVTELLDEWLQCVIQACDPWMSSKDIDRGSLWFTEINNQLQNTTIGIICLTQENLTKPWILFEAGALAKGLSTSRVCTFLIDLEPTDVSTPLSQFNHTIPTKEGIWELVRTLNTSLKDKGLKESILEQVFETYWPSFENKFNDIISSTEVAGPVIKREEDDILMEILSATRSMDRRIRMLEGKTSKYVKSGKGNFSKINNDPFMLQNLIKKLLKDNVPKSAIVDIVGAELEIPSFSAVELVNAVMEDLVKSDDA